MRTETKTVIKEVAITKEEKDTLTKIYQLAMTVYEGKTASYSCYNFSAILDMLISDLIDAEQYNDEFVIGLDDYYD